MSNSLISKKASVFAAFVSCECPIDGLSFCASSVVLSLCITGDIHKLNCSVNCDCKEDDVKYLSPPVPSGSNWYSVASAACSYICIWN